MTFSKKTIFGRHFTAIILLTFFSFTFADNENDGFKETSSEKEENTSTFRFKLGIEMNYPAYSKMNFFDNTPYPGGGLFLRMWPAGSSEFYFTTGAYFNYEAFNKKAVGDLSAFGIHIATLPLLDLKWNRTFLEIPLLLNLNLFGNEQIKFTGGLLLEFCIINSFNMYISKDIPIIGGISIYDIIRQQDYEDGIPIIIGNTSINANDADEIFSFRKKSSNEHYLVLGLDMDILKYWGIGVKFLMRGVTISILGDSDDKSLIEPISFQTRVLTYFVF